MDCEWGFYGKGRKKQQHKQQQYNGWFEAEWKIKLKKHSKLSLKLLTQGTKEAKNRCLIQKAFT